jgi:hypothetical protein
MDYIKSRGRSESNSEQYNFTHGRCQIICYTAPEPSRWDPKDGDLCLSRVKPGETLVEARRDTDVQIVRLIWV